MNGFKNAHPGIIAVLTVMLVSMNRRLPETRRLSTGITTLTLAGIVLLVAAGGASAVCNYGDPGCVGCCNGTVVGVSICYECGDTVTESCTLNANMVCPCPVGAEAPGLYVGASGITINGAGYKMTGTRGAACCGKGILFGGGAPPSDTNPAMHSGIANIGNWNNVVIKDLEIEGFCTGIALGDMFHTDVDFNEVINCSIHDCGDPAQSTHGIHMVQTNNSTITENTIYHIDGPGHAGGCSAGGNGIFLFGDMTLEDGWYNSVTHNNLSYNTKSGFFTKHMCMYNDFSYNNATGNDQGGITLRCLQSSFNDVVGNNATGNGIWGIYIGGYNNSVHNNTANETGYGAIASDDEGVGICLCRSNSDNNSIRNNTVCWNEGHGVRIIADATGNTLYDNTFCFNGQVNGVDIMDLDATTGDNNTCSTTHNFDDDGTTGCTFPCPYVGPNLVISDKTENWVVEYDTYTINYTICNLGGAASNAGWTGIYINNTHTGVNDPIGPLNSGMCVDRTFVGPFDSYGPNDTIRLWADYTDTTTEGSETDNNRTNLFGGADLIIVDYNHYWVDLSKKTYNMTYSVKNVGDRPTPEDAWVNVTDITIGGGDWSDCVDPDKIPAGLAVGATVGPHTRTFVMGDTYDWIEVWVNFDHTCPVKVWNVLQHDRDRRHATYTGPCKECGDVNCDDAIDIRDVKKVRKRAGNPNYDLDCLWAADAKCDDAVDIRDVKKVRKRAGNPNYVLDCCKGCDLW